MGSNKKTVQLLEQLNCKMDKLVTLLESQHQSQPKLREEKLLGEITKRLGESLEQKKPYY